jgi:ubiquinone/menaquinone biosynthesis C-methylase UbiE
MEERALATQAHRELVELLRCPVCRAEVQLGTNVVCRLGHSFRVEEGIPILIGDPNPSDHAQHSHQRDHFDDEYRQYATYKLENWQRVYVDRVADILPARPNEGAYLDVGAGGSGYTVIESARRGVPSVGCDISLEGMKTARRMAEAQGVGALTLFVVCTSEALPFVDGAFGATAAIAVLEHVPNDSAAIAEIVRVTRKAGGVFLAMPNALESMPWPLRWLYRRHDLRIGHLRHYRRQQLSERCEAAGLLTTRWAYSAHWAKAWQLLFHLAASRFRIKDTRLWWFFERLDQKAATRDDGLHLNLWLRRT